MEFLYILLIVFGVFGISFMMINIRQIITGKEFRGTCATNNPMLKNKVGECTVCGKKPEEECKMPEVKSA
ncbi:MAG: hypothetical protein AAFV95_16770 [Bacteroidota bacterium]